MTETLFEDVSEDDVVISKRSGVVVVDDVQCSILVERCRDCRVYVPNHVRCVRVVACVDCLVYVGAACVCSLTHCARCVLAAAAHRVVVGASAESSLRVFTPTAPLCVGGAPAAIEPLAAAYDGLARDAAAAGLLPPRAPNRWDAPLALAPGRRGAGRSRRPRRPAPRRHAARCCAARARAAEPPPLPLPADHVAASEEIKSRSPRLLDDHTRRPGRRARPGRPARAAAPGHAFTVPTAPLRRALATPVSRVDGLETSAIEQTQLRRKSRRRRAAPFPRGSPPPRAGPSRPGWSARAPSSATSSTSSGFRRGRPNF